MSADIIPFRSRFDIEAEQAVTAALFGSMLGDLVSDGGKARVLRRIARRKDKASTESPDTKPGDLA